MIEKVTHEVPGWIKKAAGKGDPSFAVCAGTAINIDGLPEGGLRTTQESDCDR